MIKVLNQYFPGRMIVLLVTENVLILGGIWAAMSYRIGSPTLGLVEYPVLLGKAFLVTIICQICLYYADIYDLRAIGSKMEVFMRVLQALGVASLILATLFYLVPKTRLGKGIVESSLLAIVLFILLWRIFVEWVNRAYGAGERLLLVGSGQPLQNLVRELEARHDLPLTVIGNVVEEGSAPEGKLKMLGRINDLGSILAECKPDRVIIALKERREKLPLDTLLKYRMKGLVIEEAHTLYQKLTGKVPVESINPSALIFTDGFKQSTLQRIYGRVTGFVAAVLGLIVLGPFMLLIAALIKLDTKGPAIYKQERVGRDGQVFQVLKFRSMRTDAEKLSGAVWAQENDPRVTRVGRILRKLRLDELPQFVNVLKGEMSFVGPRPERPHFVEQLKQQVPFYDLRHSVRPGITGWAQVSLHYGATVEDSQEKLEYDLFYIKNVSLSFDFMILFQTIKIVIFGRGAR